MSFPTHSPTQMRERTSGDDEPSINREQAGAIATLLRLVPGRAKWDQLVTLNAVLDASRLRRDLATLTAGCIRIAQDETNRTPASLRYDAAWTRAAAAPSPRASVRLNESCTVPGHDGYPASNCAGCRADQLIEARAASRDAFNHPPARFQEDQ